MLDKKGSTLIEVLISMSLLGILLLGLDAMQITALRETKSEYYFSVATQQLNNIVQQLKLLKNNLDYSVLNKWNQQNSQQLPQGKGKVIGHYPNYILQISWGKKTACKETKLGKSNCLIMRITL